MKYGYFDDEAKEYVITTSQTPWPWINYLGNEDFFSLISNTAGGILFIRMPNSDVLHDIDIIMCQWTVAAVTFISTMAILFGHPVGSHVKHRWIATSAGTE